MEDGRIPASGEASIPTATEAESGSFFRTRYRIVRDDYCGFEVQSWRWWFPFWVQGVTNTHATVERAEEYARKIAAGRPPRLVKYLGALP